MRMKGLQRTIGVLIFVMVVVGLSVSVRREHYICERYAATKEVVSWRTLVFVPLTSREENLLKKGNGQEHDHTWRRMSYKAHYFFGLWFHGVPDPFSNSASQ